MKYVIGLELHGRRFFEAIKDMGLGVLPGYSDREVFALQKHIYQDSASQIGNVITGDASIFLTQIMRLPYTGNMPDPQFYKTEVIEAFTQHFRAFAFGIYERIILKTGIQFNKDYIVEATALDYIVVDIVDKI